MKPHLICILLFCTSTFSACKDELFAPEPPGAPTATYRYIWQDFRDHYGLFGVKRLDWDSLYATIVPEIHDEMSDRELYDATVRLLSPLNDRHVTLYPASSPALPRWSVDLTEDGVYVMDDFDFGVVRDHYLTDVQEPVPFVQYAWLADKVAYLHLQHLDAGRKSYEHALDAAFRWMDGARGLVLDLRDNSGGFDPISQYVAGRFAVTEATYMTVRKKDGPGPTDFAPVQEWRVRPEGNSQFTGPVVVLTSRSTASAAETLLLALRTQAHVRQLGTTTSGSFSDAPMWEAPNGWMYTISVGDYRAADGRSYEGVGLVPNIVVENRKADLLNGRDMVLERAIEELK